MSEIRNYDNARDVAKAAAENAVEILSLAIEQNGSALWVLAGGSSPMRAYAILTKEYADAIDWSRVTVVMGDERLVPLDHKDSNWGAIMKVFDASPELSQVARVIPDVTGDAARVAAVYNRMVSQLAATRRFDLVWIGVGEDGHTLSLFPGNAAFLDSTNSWVVPVYDSPKPPSERFTLSMYALEHVSELVIFAVGAAKREVLRTARLKGKLPVAVVANLVESCGGEVRWLYDDAAWGEK
jgi:6-phosphogluconolactonase